MRTQYRWIWLLLAALLVSTLVSTAGVPALAAEKSLVWERFDVDIQVNADGTFDVAEHQAIRFIDGTFKFGYRDIPKQNFGYITDWAVTDASGNTYMQTYGGEVPYTFVVDDQGGSYVIRWYFPPTSDPQTYTLSYRVHDGLRYYSGGDQLWWKAVYGDRQFPVLASRVRVMVPAPAVIQEYAAYINDADARDSVTAEMLNGNRAILFEAQRTLRAGQELEVRAQFTSGVVAGTAPAWQSRADAQAAQREAEAAYQQQWGPIATLFSGVLALALLLGGPALAYLMWYKYAREKPVARVADYLPEPPDDLPPGLAGTLVDDSADMQDIIATIVDLARRKAISITEVKEQGFFRMGTDFIYRRERTDVPLSPFESKLITDIFGSKQEKKLSDLKNKFYQDIPDIKTAMYDDLIGRGYYKTSPDSARKQFGCLGGAVMAVGAAVSVLFTILLVDLTPAAICPGFGIFALAIALLVVSRYMPRKTDEGSEAVARWKAFKEYLRNIDKYTDLDAQKEIWDRWLPYAIAFGIDKDYIRKFEGVNAPAPGWYIPSPTLYGPYHRRYYGPGSDQPPVFLPGSGPSEGGGFPGGGGSLGGGLSSASRGMGTSLASMSAGLGSMLSSASSTMTSRPSSSGSSGGWGGGGFSGGGGFGGGGGGGGGGGFG